MAVEAQGRRPRILLTADTVGRVWTYALGLAAQLCAGGMDVHLATMGALPSPQQRAQAQAIEHLSLHESGFRLEWMPDPWHDLDEAGRWLLALERQLQPELVHLNQFAFGALPFSAPTLLVAHSCVLSWWQAVPGRPVPPVGGRYRDTVAAGLAGAGLVAAPTRAMRDALVAHYGFQGPVRVLPNGRDPALFAPAPKQPFILAAGRLWDQAKNLAALDDVAPALAWPVRVAGACTGPDGSERAPRRAQSLGVLSPHALAQQMAQAAIYALPARYEPFGLSVLEAALSGCALVLGDIPSLRETWDSAAVFVPPDDHAALQHTLSVLAADVAARQRLADAARTRAAQYTARRMADATRAAYARLLSGPHPCPPPSSKEAACA